MDNIFRSPIYVVEKLILEIKLALVYKRFLVIYYLCTAKLTYVNWVRATNYAVVKNVNDTN